MRCFPGVRRPAATRRSTLPAALRGSSSTKRDVLGPLVTGQPRARERHDLLRGHKSPGASGPPRGTTSPQRSSGTPNTATSATAGWSEHRFDLGRVHVLAAGDDHVLDPVDDEQVAVGVDVAAVAGMQPAVGGEQLRGLLGQPEVAGGVLGGAGPHLSRRRRRHLLPRPPGRGSPARSTDTGRPSERCSGESAGRSAPATISVSDAGGLRQAVHLVQYRPEEPQRRAWVSALIGDAP